MKEYFKFKCVYCGQSIECETRYSGRQTKCPSCSHKMVVPPAPGQQGTGDSPNTINSTWNSNVDDPDVTVPTRYMEGGQQPPPDDKPDTK